MPEPAGEASIEDLVQEHYAPLYRFARRLSGSTADAEDLTQQTFLHAQAHMVQLRNPEKARAWLFAILQNAYRQYVRERSRQRIERLDILSEDPPAQDGIERTDIDEEQLQHALDRLPEEFRTPVVLFYFEHFSYRQIAELMHIPLGTVMSRLARGKAHLRAQLLPRAAAGASSRRRPPDEL